MTGGTSRPHNLCDRPHIIVSRGTPDERNQRRRPRVKAVTDALQCAGQNQSVWREEATHMTPYFNIAERGGGSYRMLAILRWVMVVVFVSFGIQKFTLQSAEGIVQYISNSPFVSWLSLFGFRGEAYVLGVAEFAIAELLAAGAFSPILSAVGSLMGVVTFAITWSFFFTTPGAVKWSLSADPIAWNLTGEFLFKDIVLLCVCVVLFLASLPKSVIRLRTS